MSKVRTSIPSDIAADIMFGADNTCCVCRERGKALQIHHTDDNPSNNRTENLAALCLECHNDTQIQGGFGRKLTAEVVVRYRDEWVVRVEKRRNEADRHALELAIPERASQTSPQPVAEPIRAAPLSYISALPDFKAALRKQAKVGWDTGVTSTMVQASYDYIDALQGILVTLAHYYSPTNFGGRARTEFFSDVIASRFQWHRSHQEPHGPGTGGTIVNVLCSGDVADDVERMVEDMAMSLVGYNDDFDWRGWRDRWRNQE
jgi:hypothetical protein